MRRTAYQKAKLEVRFAQGSMCNVCRTPIPTVQEASLVTICIPHKREYLVHINPCARELLNQVLSPAPSKTH